MISESFAALLLSLGLAALRARRRAWLPLPGLGHATRYIEWMIRSIFDLLILFALVVTVGVVPATADDTLGDFEDEIEKREQNNSKRRNTNNADYTVDSDEDAAEGEFFGNVLGAIFSGLFLSAGSTAEHFRSTTRGSPASAAVRLEGAQPADMLERAIKSTINFG